MKGSQTVSIVGCEGVTRLLNARWEVSGTLFLRNVRVSGQGARNSGTANALVNIAPPGWSAQVCTIYMTCS